MPSIKSDCQPCKLMHDGLPKNSKWLKLLLWWIANIKLHTFIVASDGPQPVEHYNLRTFRIRSDGRPTNYRRRAQ